MAKSEQISKVDDLYAQGKYQEAATECTRMLDGLPENSGERAVTLLKMGKLHDKLHNLEKAIDCLRKSLEISQKVFGENNEKTAEAMSALALALAANGVPMRQSHWLKRQQRFAAKLVAWTVLKRLTHMTIWGWCI